MCVCVCVSPLQCVYLLLADVPMHWGRYSPNMSKERRGEERRDGMIEGGEGEY